MLKAAERCLTLLIDAGEPLQRARTPVLEHLPSDKKWKASGGPDNEAFINVTQKEKVKWEKGDGKRQKGKGE